MDAFSEELRDLCHGVKRDGGVVGIEKAVDGGAAGLEPAGHLGLADFAGVHGFGEFVSDFEFDGGGAAVLEQAIISKKIFEIRAEVFLFHREPHVS